MGSVSTVRSILESIVHEYLVIYLIRMKRPRVLYVLLVWLFVTPACILHATVQRPAKPNVVLILTDDLGWQDVKCYDIDEPSPMETPNLDALAKKGVLFWQGYSPSPVCAPSRAAILSGLHPARAEMTSVAGGFPPHAESTDAAIISPFFTARMPTERYTIAEALKAAGYATAHSGKWHISKHHYDYPTPYYHGFDQSTHHRGVQSRMTPDRLSGFATDAPGDPYRLDENGMPFDVPQNAALSFIKDSKDKPFFLYYATWLVHTPIVMRSEALLRKYETKLGVQLTAKHAEIWDMPGQTNPFYCAMVEQLDYYMGQIFSYLEETDDPRWPGHKLIENTYIIFSSDNGGMEGQGSDVFTDNFPLDRGKISLREGGTRVPLIITGPGIPADVQTQVMVNGLDFYPTILSLVGAPKPKGKIFDGCDLKPLLTQDPCDPTLVQTSDGKVRDTMFWHFPQMEKSSSIRSGDYKLLRRYEDIPASLELTRLYNSDSGRTVRGDIEESLNLAATLPEKVAELDQRLDGLLNQHGGRRPYLNPKSSASLRGKHKVPVVLECQQHDSKVCVTYQHNGTDVAYADLIYSQNDGREWLRASGELNDDSKATFDLPKGITHYFINLVDENNFMVVYPHIDLSKMNRDGEEFSDVAIFAGYPKPQLGSPVDFRELYQHHSSAKLGRLPLCAFDFDSDEIGLYTSGSGVSLVRDVKDSSKQALQLYEADELKHPWMPLVSSKLNFSSNKTSGIFRVNLDVFLDANSPGALNLMLKDKPKRLSLGSVQITPEAIRANKATVAGVTPGAWYHIEVSGGFGLENNKRLTISVIAENGDRWSTSVPYSNYHFDRPSHVELSGIGTVGSAARIDNLVVTIE